ncbi:MAG: hypothetical protein M1825_001970 [Sarcosagium campestre]|nr:MAG: hypothetical protein M1825_001970 [Sarcosagium campestre]
MAENVATPRISAPHLETFTNQTVRILGRVTAVRGEQATVDAEGEITALLNNDAHLTLNNAVELLCKVNSDLSVKVIRATDFGSDIDFKAVAAVVDATHRYREIFYES